MAVRNNADPQPTDRELIITRVFDAPRSLIFKVWTEPKHLVHWWGPKGFTLPTCTMDFRLGGAYRFCMRSPEGTDHWLQGVYREIMEPERLVFTQAWEDAEGKPKHETLVTVIFADQGGKTLLTFHQGVFESVTSRDEHEGGWSSAFELLTEYLAKA